MQPAFAPATLWPVGINPIVWTNDDFPELGEGISLDRCLSEMRAAGYEGTELGRKYPRDPAGLAAALDRHGLRLVSGWHSTYLAGSALDRELVSLGAHLELLTALGAQVCILAECTHRTYHRPEVPMEFDGDRPSLSETEWTRVIAGFRALAERCGAAGVRPVYHHHVGTVVQAQEDLNRLLEAVPGLFLLFDPGHLALANADPFEVLERHGSRIGHVHLKNIRPAVAARARRERWSFHRAVCEGVFSVPGDGSPGDGSIDFTAVLNRLGSLGYRGWLVVEAEEDPERAEPLGKARRARKFIRLHAGV